MTARTPSQQGAYSRRKGHAAERAVCAWLRENGFPGAERSVRAGFRTGGAGGRSSADPGDIRDAGAIWSVKDVAESEAAWPTTMREWWNELAAMDPDAQVPRLIVHKRRGTADVGHWWCWLRLHTLLHLASASTTVDLGDPAEPVRMELGHVVPLLRAAGYGEPLAD